MQILKDAIEMMKKSILRNMQQMMLSLLWKVKTPFLIVMAYLTAKAVYIVNAIVIKENK